MKKLLIAFLVSAFLLANLTIMVSCADSETDNQLWIKVENVAKADDSNLSISTIEIIKRLQRRGYQKVSDPWVIDALVKSGANCLNDNADWVDQERGRKIYELLKSVKGDLVTDSLARLVLKPVNRLHILFLGVKLGIEGSQERLNGILIDHGDVSMAEDFLNSGSQALFDGGKKWANEHGYYIAQGMGSHRVAWGRF